MPLGKFYISLVSKTLFSAFSSVFFFIVTDRVFSLLYTKASHGTRQVYEVGS